MKIIVFSLFVTEQAREDLVVFRSVRLMRLNESTDSLDDTMNEEDS